MNTKEAIEWLKTKVVLTRENWEQDIKGIDELTALLQSLSTAKEEGEKYKAMWEGLKQENGTEFTYFDNDLIRPKTRNLEEIMDILEQKYFPQPVVKKKWTIELEAKNENVIKWFKNAVEDLQYKNIQDSHIKVNIKEGTNAD